MLARVVFPSFSFRRCRRPDVLLALSKVRWSQAKLIVVLLFAGWSSVYAIALVRNLLLRAHRRTQSTMMV